MASNGFNPYAAGNKVYKAGSNAPTRGPVSAKGMLGYKTRSATQNAILRRLRAQQSGNYMQPDVMRKLAQNQPTYGLGQAGLGGLGLSGFGQGSITSRGLGLWRLNG